ncbi:MAG: hypothetical protein ACRC9L_02505 [Brevinema sp.]
MKSIKVFLLSVVLGWLGSLVFPLIVTIGVSFSRRYFSVIPQSMIALWVFNVMNALLMILLGRLHRYLPLVQLSMNGFFLGVFWSFLGFWLPPHVLIETTAIILCAHISYSRNYRLFPLIVVLLACGAFFESSLFM